MSSDNPGFKDLNPTENTGFLQEPDSAVANDPVDYGFLLDDEFLNSALWGEVNGAGGPSASLKQTTICRCHNMLREILFSKDRETRRLTIFGEIGFVCHIYLSIHMMSSDDKECQCVDTVDMTVYTLNEVKKFIEDYCTQREALGFTLVEDQNYDFYQAMSARSLTHVEPTLAAKGQVKVKRVGEDLNYQAAAPGKKTRKDWDSQDSGLNLITFDETTMPVPMCTCTGSAHQCHKWGNGGWQSSCCTTTLSQHPLPQMPNNRRMGGRKMSGDVYSRLITRLASEGYDLSNPVDLKDHWARRGTNRYITIK